MEVGTYQRQCFKSSRTLRTRPGSLEPGTYQCTPSDSWQRLSTTLKVLGLCSPGLEAWSLEPINADSVSLSTILKVLGLCAPGLEAWSLEPINADSVSLSTILKVLGLCAPGLEAWSLEPTSAHVVTGITSQVYSKWS